MHSAGSRGACLAWCVGAGGEGGRRCAAHLPPLRAQSPGHASARRHTQAPATLARERPAP